VRGSLLVAVPGAVIACGGGPTVAARAPLPGAAGFALAADPTPDALVPAADPGADRRPMHRLRHRCEDRRFPSLAGAWLLGCDGLGRVAWAEGLPDGPQVEISEPSGRIGAAGGALYAHAPTPHTWRLPDPSPAEAGAWGLAVPIASPAFDGAHVALALDGRIAAFGVGDRVQLSWEAAPRPWFPPAISWPTVLWVDDRDAAARGTDLWRWDQGGGPPRPFVVRPGDQRHVAAGEGWAAWTDEEGVWLARLADGARWLRRCEAGFRAGPALWSGAVCWEERAAGDIDVACSDGLRVGGPGDQGWPSRSGPWLLYREGDEVWLATARELTVRADDPRAIPIQGGGFAVRLAWPAPGWCAEAAARDGWVQAGRVPVGDAVELRSPGEALRLAPCPGGEAA